MDIDFIISALFVIASFALAAYTFNRVLAHYLVADVVENDEAPEEDAVQYTPEFERYWIWSGSLTGIPNIFMSDRVKPVAFRSWQAGRRQLTVGSTD